MPDRFDFQGSAHWQHFFISYHERLIYEKHSLRYCGDLYYWLDTWRFCMECYRFNSYFDHTRRYFIVVGYHSKSLGFSISVFLIYTVHSISKATVLYCSHFFPWTITADIGLRDFSFCHSLRLIFFMIM
jgi:hypothetical protein